MSYFVIFELEFEKKSIAIILKLLSLEFFKGRSFVQKNIIKFEAKNAIFQFTYFNSTPTYYLNYKFL